LLRHDPGDAAHLGGGRALPHASDGVSVVETGHRLPEVTHEVRAAELPVGEDVEPELALAREALEYGLVLELPDPCRRRRGIVARREQPGGAEKAPDLIGAI